MGTISELYQSDDWKNEKHVPVIEAPASVAKGTPFQVSIAVGKEISHPNKTEHHIRWVELYFKADGKKFVHQVGEFSFTAHGEGTDGPDTGVVSTEHQVSCTLTVKDSGTLIATAYCNIHGLWESSVPLKAE